VAKILSVPGNPSPEFFDVVVKCTSHGGVLSVATESFYALAAPAFSSIAVDRVAEIKGRSSEKPLLALIGERSQLDTLVSSVPSWAVFLLDHFWPGPLTCIFQARSDLPEPLTGGGKTIGVRCPGDRQLLSILNATGPLTGTSANRTGSAPLSTAEGVQKEFGEKIDLILDSGPAPGGLPSTILSLVETPHILREGPISSEAIQAILAKQGIILADTVDG
jgi:L-threonylcarbamoyladenylate synthase